MINFIRKLWNSVRRKDKVTPDQVDHPDEFARETIARCFNTGKCCVGNKNDDGTWTIEELDER